MESSQDPSPLKWSKHSLKWHPHGAALGNAHSFVSRRGGKASPLPQRCIFPAHGEATLPCVSCHDDNIIVAITVSVAIAIAIAVSAAIAIAVAITNAVGHCHCRCHWQLLLPLPLLSAIAIAVSVAIAVAITVTIAIAVGNHRCRCHQPSLLPLPSAIAVAIAVIVTIANAVSVGHRHCHHRCKGHLPQRRRRSSLESCCLCSATILFEQFRQIMLTLFFFGQ